MSEISIITEHYEKRFGIIAIEMGYISHQDLVMALKIQVLEDFLDGEHRLLRIILLDENKMTGQQVGEVMEIILYNPEMDSGKTAKVFHFPIQNSAACASY